MSLASKEDTSALASNNPDSGSEPVEAQLEHTLDFGRIAFPRTEVDCRRDRATASQVISALFPGTALIEFVENQADTEITFSAFEAPEERDVVRLARLLSLTLDHDVKVRCVVLDPSGELPTSALASGANIKATFEATAARPPVRISFQDFTEVAGFSPLLPYTAAFQERFFWSFVTRLEEKHPAEPRLVPTDAQSGSLEQVRSHLTKALDTSSIAHQYSPDDPRIVLDITPGQLINDRGYAALMKLPLVPHDRARNTVECRPSQETSAREGRDIPGGRLFWQEVLNSDDSVDVKRLDRELKFALGLGFSPYSIKTLLSERTLCERPGDPSLSFDQRRQEALLELADVMESVPAQLFVSSGEIRGDSIVLYGRSVGLPDDRLHEALACIKTTKCPVVFASRPGQLSRGDIASGLEALVACAGFRDARVEVVTKGYEIVIRERCHERYELRTELLNNWLKALNETLNPEIAFVRQTPDSRVHAELARLLGTNLLFTWEIDPNTPVVQVHAFGHAPEALARLKQFKADPYRIVVGDSLRLPSDASYVQPETPVRLSYEGLSERASVLNQTIQNLTGGRASVTGNHLEVILPAKLPKLLAEKLRTLLHDEGIPAVVIVREHRPFSDRVMSAIVSNSPPDGVWLKSIEYGSDTLSLKILVAPSCDRAVLTAWGRELTECLGKQFRFYSENASAPFAHLLETATPRFAELLTTVCSADGSLNLRFDVGGVFDRLYVPTVTSRPKTEYLLGSRPRFTHPVTCIDPAATQIHEDGFTILDEGNGRLRVYVHYSDPTPFVVPGSREDEALAAAAERPYASSSRNRNRFQAPLFDLKIWAEKCDLVLGRDVPTVTVSWLVDPEKGISEEKVEYFRVSGAKKIARERALALLQSEKVPLDLVNLNEASHLTAKTLGMRDGKAPLAALFNITEHANTILGDFLAARNVPAPFRRQVPAQPEQLRQLTAYATEMGVPDLEINRLSSSGLPFRPGIDPGAREEHRMVEYSATPFANPSKQFWLGGVKGQGAWRNYGALLTLRAANSVRVSATAIERLNKSCRWQNQIGLEVDVALEAVDAMRLIRAGTVLTGRVTAVDGAAALVQTDSLPLPVKVPARDSLAAGSTVTMKLVNYDVPPPGRLG